MPGIPDNSAGSSHCRQRDEDQACAPPSGPGAPSPDSQAAYTQAIRPLYPTFFENALAFGGSPYTLLDSVMGHIPEHAMPRPSRLRKIKPQISRPAPNATPSRMLFRTIAPNPATIRPIAERPKEVLAR